MAERPFGMRSSLLRFWMPPAVVAATFVAFGFSLVQGEDPLDAVAVGKMVEGLGYEVKPLSTDPGKEKYTFTITKGGLDIPIGAEVSNSKNYIWLTINFGEAAKPTEASGAKMHALLNWNSKIQPCQFYITDSGRLMMGYAVENRNVTPAILRRTIDKVSDDAARTQDAWKNGGK